MQFIGKKIIIYLIINTWNVNKPDLVRKEKLTLSAIVTNNINYNKQVVIIITLKVHYNRRIQI